MAHPDTLPRTLGELKASGWQSVPVSEEIRRNAVAKISAGEPLFEGVLGYEHTVMPQLENALLAGHDIIFLGERGQGKTRLMIAQGYAQGIAGEFQLLRVTAGRITMENVRGILLGLRPMTFTDDVGSGTGLQFQHDHRQHDGECRQRDSDDPKSNTEHAQVEFAAPAEVAAALALASSLPLDAVVLVRGGGARTDLAAFDAEIVARAHACGASHVIPAFGMTLRDRQRSHYYAQLDRRFPGTREKLSLIHI